jgi:4-amino-4-deoxy-L-arabinose transferase-like glycosyltransferase
MSRSVVATALAVAFFALLAGALTPLVDRDEPQYAEVVREMRASGDWLVPRNFGHLFADKPPGLYWLQALSEGVFGESEMALRLPSALAAGLIVVLTAAIAARFGLDPLVAGTIALPGVVLAGAFAIPDAPVAACTALSLWAFLRAADGTDGWESAMLGWVALAAGVALKGPAAPLFVGAAVAGRVSGDRAAIRRLSPLWGLTLVVGLTALWFVPANLATSWEYVRRGIGHDVIARAVHPLEHHGFAGVLGVLAGPPFYVAVLLVAACPFAFAPWRMWRDRARFPRRLVSTIVGGIGGPLVVLSFVATKLPHYLLPALPLVAVAAAATGQRGRAVAWGVSGAFLVGFVIVAHLAPWPEVGRSLAGGPTVFAVGFEEPSLLYYARGAVRVATPTELITHAQVSSTLAVMPVPNRWSGRIATAGIALTPLRTWYGLNLAKGRWVELELFALRPRPSLRERPPNR